MKISFLSGNGALKFLLLLTSLSHYYSGLVTGADSAKDICASFAANNPVNFFLVGRRSSNFLLITAQPDYLVYELDSDTLQNDTVNMSGVKPVPLENYFPVLYRNETFQKFIFGKNESQVKIFTTGKATDSGPDPDTYLRMISMDGKLLLTYNMNSNDTDLTPDINVPLPVQEFVSSSDNQYEIAQFYSFYYNQENGPIRMNYNLDSQDAVYECTCKTTNGELVLRSKEKGCNSFGYWTWAESYKGWAEYFIELNSTVRFYLFDKTNQQVMIFDQDDSGIADGKDVISVVRYKKYKDFFVCPPPKVTTSIPSTTSAQPSTTSIVTEVANRTTVTSATLVYNASSKSGPDSMETSTEKSKLAVWIIILIVVLLVAIFFTVLTLAWYYYGGKKTSDSKPDKVVSKGTMPKVRSTVSGGKQSSVLTSKVLSTKVITSKVASSAKAQSSKQLVGAGMSRDAANVKAKSSAAL